MKKYIWPCLRVWSVLYKLEGITLRNKLRLFQKTINLFICFLAFADRRRSREQVFNAAICALCSSVYDYETDWFPVEDVEKSHSRLLIDMPLINPEAVQVGWKLFVTDREKRLSEHGLERGSMALEFYRLIIKSNWLMFYTKSQIEECGMNLQILDDLLDREEDDAAGDKNCFLLGDESRLLYERKAIEFLNSDFFKKLEDNSMVYHKLRQKCQTLLGVSRREEKPTIKSLISTCRPLTGVFAFLLTILGFRLVHLPFAVSFLPAIGLFCITLNIMIFNDVLDRHRDEEKGKLTAFKYPFHVLRLWKNASIFVLLVIACISFSSYAIAMLCVVVWILGLLYSILKPPYPFNNLLVAACSGAPVLAGMTHSGCFCFKPLLVFCIILSTIMVTEIVKDLQDADGDFGYKNTSVTKNGRNHSLLLAITLSCLPVTFIMMYPDCVVRATACFFSVAMFPLAYSFTRTRPLYWVERIMDVFLGALLLTLLARS